MYEGSFSTRFSDLLISTDSLVCAESVSAGIGLRSAFSLSIGPLQLTNVMVLITAIIFDSRQVSCTRSVKCFVELLTEGINLNAMAAMFDFELG